MKEETFFDDNYEFHDQDVASFDHLFVNFLQNNIINDVPTLLDVGGLSGGVSKLAMNSIPKMEYTVLDPSVNLLNSINDHRNKKIKGKLPYDVEVNEKHDFIHIKEFLHHITGPSVNESKEMVKNTLKILNNVLKEDGFLLIHELFYEGYLIPELSSYMLFYLLKLQNTLKVKLSLKHFLLGLNVFFYTRTELISLIEKCGFRIENVYVNDFCNNTKKNLFLKDWGRVLLIVKKIP